MNDKESYSTVKDILELQKKLERESEKLEKVIEFERIIGENVPQSVIKQKTIIDHRLEIIKGLIDKFYEELNKFIKENKALNSSFIGKKIDEYNNIVKKKNSRVNLANPLINHIENAGGLRPLIEKLQRELETIVEQKESIASRIKILEQIEEEYFKSVYKNSDIITPKVSKMNSEISSLDDKINSQNNIVSITRSKRKSQKANKKIEKLRNKKGKIEAKQAKLLNSKIRKVFGKRDGLREEVTNNKLESLEKNMDESKGIRQLISFVKLRIYELYVNVSGIAADKLEEKIKKFRSLFTRLKGKEKVVSGARKLKASLAEKIKAEKEELTEIINNKIQDTVDNHKRR